MEIRAIRHGLTVVERWHFREVRAGRLLSQDVWMGWSWLWNRSGSAGIQSVSRVPETEDNCMIQEPLPVAAVVHGGTIMALLSHYCGGDYFSYQVKNAEGYHLRLSLQENKMELKEKV